MAEDDVLVPWADMVNHSSGLRKRHARGSGRPMLGVGSARGLCVLIGDACLRYLKWTGEIGMSVSVGA